MEIKFGTGGFRGEINKEFNKESISKIGEALALTMLENHTKQEIVIGYDRRYLSKEASEILTAIFISHGIKVNLHLTECPSPLVMYFVQKWNLPYGIMITASHNPAHFNGIKVFVEGGYDADAEFTNMLEKKINSLSSYPDVSFDINSPDLRMFNGVNEYVDNIINFSGSHINKNLHIAYDNLNGVGVITIEPLFNKLGVNLSILNKEKDSSFRGKLPNPLIENLTDLKEYVLENKCDFGFACDSDADRLGVIDEKGNYVSANEILAIIYYYLVKYEGMKGDIVKNLVSSTMIDMVANNAGFKCYDVDVGFKNITHGMKEHDALIGGECSGGLTVRNYIHGKDSTFSVMMFLCAISKINKPVSEVIKEVINFTKYNKVFREYFYSYSKDNVDKIVDYLEEHEPKFSLTPVSKIKLGRNYKWIFEDNQFLAIRLSNTEPVIRIVAELDSEELTNKEFENLHAFIKPLQK